MMKLSDVLQEPLVLSSRNFPTVTEERGNPTQRLHKQPNQSKKREKGRKEKEPSATQL